MSNIDVSNVVSSLNEFLEGINVSNETPGEYRPVAVYTIITITEYDEHMATQYGIVANRHKAGYTTPPTHIMRMAEVIGRDGYDPNEDCPPAYYGNDMMIVVENGVARFMDGEDPDSVYGGGPEYNGGTKGEITEWLSELGAEVVWL